MAEQIHKRLTKEQVEMILERYVKKEIGSNQAMDLLGVQRSQFFEWVKKYKEKGEGFTIEYKRKGNTRSISIGLEQNILKELRVEKAMIDDPAMTIRYYNYSFIKDEIFKKYQQEVSLPTIISRAKKTAFTFQCQRRRFMTMK
jgi:transposase